MMEGSEILIPLEVQPVMREIERGMDLKKCRKCGCMQDALDEAARAFGASEDPGLQALLPEIDRHMARMEPIAYDCIGCKKCWGADATKELSVRFEDVEGESCGSGWGTSNGDAPVVRLPDPKRLAWPPYPGDYIVGNAAGAVAVCTLSSRDLAASIIAAGDPSVAIAGRCDTENIGVEKVVLNVLANPAIRFLVLAGIEAEGHRTGDAFLQLKEKGVDANMRVLESASWRPVLKNLTIKEVARFREQVDVVNLLGTTDAGAIVQTARACAAKDRPPLSLEDRGETPSFERIVAKAPKGLRLDPSGFFIVLPNLETGVIVCEHYENNGRLVHVVEGRQAAVIAATVVERGLITRLDHAAYLGRELAKADISLKTGLPYEQDAALGTLPPSGPDVLDVPEILSECSGASCNCK